MSHERFQSIPSKAYHEDFFKKVLDLLLRDAVFGGTCRDSPVVRWRTPGHLKEILDLELTAEPAGDEVLLKAIEDTVKFSVKTGHPYFINQLFSSLDPYGLVGQLVTDCLNPSAYTFEVAPVFTLMEAEVLRNMRQLVGFSNGDGMFCPGGSFANGFAINLARYKYAPHIKKSGQSESRRLVLFTSEDAHYSVYKMAALCGLGEDNVIQIKTDAVGRMNISDLQVEIERCLCEGAAPFMIYATAGTTVLGAFDKLEPLAKLRDQYQLWLHVDAAWGGGVLFSTAHRHLLDGVHLADSVTWNPHKLLAVPQQCSVLLVADADILDRCHCRHADYLFQKDKFYDTSYDTGDKYLQCGRRADVFKFWLMWKAKGSRGFERHVDGLFSVARHLLNGVRARPNFTLVAEPEFVNVCFWFVPPRLQTLVDHPDYYHMLHKVAPRLKEQMMRRGSMMINYQPLKQWPNFLRFVVQSSAVTTDDVDYFLHEIDRLGDDLESPLL